MMKLLFKEKELTKLLAGDFISKIGDGIFHFVFVISALNVTDNNAALTGLIYFFSFIPYLFMGPLGGVIADKTNKKNIMVLSDSFRAILTVSLSFLIYSESLDIFSLSVVGLLMTSFRALFQPSFQSSIPILVRKPNLQKANSYVQISHEIGGIIGPSLAGFLVALQFNIEKVLLLDSLSYFLSIAFLLSVKLPSNKESEVPIGKALSFGKALIEVKANVRNMLAERRLLVTIVNSSICILLVGSLLRILIPSFINDNYGQEYIGYAFSLIALGTVVGAALCGKLLKESNSNRLMTSWALYGIAISLIPIVPINIIFLFAGCAILGVVGAFVDIILITNIQSLSSSEDIGKNFSIFSTLANSGEALSGTLTGLFTLFFSVGGTITFVGTLVSFVAIGGLRKKSIIEIGENRGAS